MSRESATSIVYREGLFTPAQAAACTGLSPAMQRNWRQAGHIAGRTTEVALFGPRDLATIRIMVVLRDVGLGPALSRSIAEQMVPSVLWLALVNYPTTWSVAGDAEQAAAYRRQLELVGDFHLRAMAGLAEDVFTFGIVRDKTVHLVAEITDAAFDEDDEVERVIKLSAVAKRIALGTNQPLMTLILPSTS